MARSVYRKLTGRARSFTGFSQLWIAPDHLLLLRSTRFHEHYWRYAFADIQSIVVTELPSRLPLQLTVGAIVVLWGLAYFLVDSSLAKGFFLITGGLGLLLVILDVARGPRCRCFLHTAVSREPLSPIQRMRTARKVLEQLQPAVEAVQGSLPMEQMQAVEDRVSTRAYPAAVDRPPEIRRSPGYLPEVVFGMFLINAVIILIGVRFKIPQVMSVLLTTLFAEVLVLVVALIRRASTDFRRYIYIVMLAALIGIGWDAVLFAQSFGHWFAAVADAGAHGRIAPVPTAPGAPFDRTHGLIAASWRIAASVIGLIAARLERPPKSSHNSAPPDSDSAPSRDATPQAQEHDGAVN